MIVAVVAVIAGVVIVLFVTKDDDSDVDAGNAAATSVADATTTSATTVGGPTNEQITNAQEALAAVGCYTGPIDGIHGPQTDAAIRAFQSAKGLVVDGIVGPQTVAALQDAQTAGETVCGGDSGSGGEETGVPGPPAVHLTTSDGVERSFDVVSCTSSGASSFELTAESETARLTATVASGTGPIVLTEGGGHREGTVKEAHVETSGALGASGSLTPADDSAKAATFELTGTCAAS